MTVETLPQQNGVVFNGDIDTNPSSNASKKSRDSERRRRRRKQKKNKAARVADATTAADDSDAAADDDAKENDDPQQVLSFSLSLSRYFPCSIRILSWFLGFCLSGLLELGVLFRYFWSEMEAEFVWCIFD